MFPKEFAFSPDNLGPITFMPWFTIHENDPEAILLADLVGTIRADLSFQRDFSSRIDTLLEDQGICQRGNDEFLHFPREISPIEYFEKNAAIWQQADAEGYPDRAVNILERAGYEAWKNSVGDIAIRPL